MVYSVLISPRAIEEIEAAIDFYALSSTVAPKNFITELEDLYGVLSKYPYFSICYKNIRTISLKKFPYTLFYIIDEHKKVIRILSCFHQNKNPQKRP